MSTSKVTTNGAAPAAGAPITLERLRTETVEIPIVGKTPLIMNRFSEKAKRMMLDKQQGKASPKKAPKNPVEDFEAAKYLLEDGSLGFPATGFKSAMVDATTFFGKEVAGTTVRRAVWLMGEGSDQLVRITGDCRMREDAVRLADINRTADLRYRPEVWPWEAMLTIDYVSTSLTLDAIVALVDAAGRIGIGEWRPGAVKSKTGTYGTFRVAEERM